MRRLSIPKDRRGFLRGWRPLLILLAGAGLVAIGFGLQVALRREEIPGIIPAERAETGGRSVEVFFPEESGSWSRVRREILASPVREEEIRRLVQELLRGPREEESKDASPVFPSETRIENVFWDGEGELTLSFSEHLRSDHPGGSRAEAATVHAILGSVKASFPEVVRVKILIEGETVSSIAGHIDLSSPLDAFIPR
jgi:hypothetical protein